MEHPTLEFYTQPSVMTSAGRYASLFDELPNELSELLRIIQHLAVRQRKCWTPFLLSMTGRIPGALILTWLFYAYQRWRFDDYEARARQRAEGADGVH